MPNQEIPRKMGYKLSGIRIIRWFVWTKRVSN